MQVHTRSTDEEVPPPLPVKVRRPTVGSLGGQRGSISSPTTTPTHATYQLVGYSARADGLVDYPGGRIAAANLPLVPMRMESIPGVKTVLGQDTPPPKPPRSDRPNSIEMVWGLVDARQI